LTFEAGRAGGGVGCSSRVGDNGPRGLQTNCHGTESVLQQHERRPLTRGVVHVHDLEQLVPLNGSRTIMVASVRGRQFRSRVSAAGNVKDVANIAVVVNGWSDWGWWFVMIAPGGMVRSLVGVHFVFGQVGFKAASRARHNDFLLVSAAFSVHAQFEAGQSAGGLFRRGRGGRLKWQCHIGCVNDGRLTAFSNIGKQTSLINRLLYCYKSNIGWYLVLVVDPTLGQCPNLGKAGLLLGD